MNILRLGAIGPDVVAWEKVLGIPSDGVFSLDDEAATHAWQMAHGLNPDGIVGPLTWGAAGLKDGPSIIPIQGLDVSALQGGSIPWDAEYKRGSAFVYSRCQVGNNTWKDTHFAENSRRAMVAGLFPGAYFFPFPLPHLDPKAQVDIFCKAATVSGHLLGSERGELPPAHDLEWPPPEEWGKWKCTADQIVDWNIIALEYMEAQFGVRPVLYSYPYFLSAISKAKNFAQLLKHKLWIAGGSQYVNGDGHIPDLGRERPPKVVGWDNDWWFWQHDGNGGRRLTHGVDADFNVFRLPLGELERFCGMGPDVTPVPDTLPDLSVILQATSKLIVEDSIHAFRKERAEAIFNTGV